MQKANWPGRGGPKARAGWLGPRGSGGLVCVMVAGPGGGLPAGLCSKPRLPARVAPHAPACLPACPAGRRHHRGAPGPGGGGGPPAHRPAGAARARGRAVRPAGRPGRSSAATGGWWWARGRGLGLAPRAGRLCVRRACRCVGGRRPLCCPLLGCPHACLTLAHAPPPAPSSHPCSEKLLVVTAMTQDEAVEQIENVRRRRPARPPRPALAAWEGGAVRGWLGLCWTVEHMGDAGRPHACVLALRRACRGAGPACRRRAAWTARAAHPAQPSPTRIPGSAAPRRHAGRDFLDFKQLAPRLVPLAPRPPGRRRATTSSLYTPRFSPHLPRPSPARPQVGHDFFIFKDSADGAVKVLYRRK